MTVFKIKNSSHSRQALHTVLGVLHIGGRKTREFDLTPEGEKLVRASDSLEIVGDQKAKSKKSPQKPASAKTEPESNDVHSDGQAQPEGQSGEGGGGSDWSA